MDRRKRRRKEGRRKNGGRKFEISCLQLRGRQIKVFIWLAFLVHYGVSKYNLQEARIGKLKIKAPSMSERIEQIPLNTKILNSYKTISWNFINYQKIQPYSRVPKYISTIVLTMKNIHLVIQLIIHWAHLCVIKSDNCCTYYGAYTRCYLFFKV